MDWLWFKALSTGSKYIYIVFILCKILFIIKCFTKTKNCLKNILNKLQNGKINWILIHKTCIKVQTEKEITKINITQLLWPELSFVLHRYKQVVIYFAFPLTGQNGNHSWAQWQQKQPVASLPILFMSKVYSIGVVIILGTHVKPEWISSENDLIQYPQQLAHDMYVQQHILTYIVFVVYSFHM